MPLPTLIHPRVQNPVTDRLAPSNPAGNPFDGEAYVDYVQQFVNAGALPLWLRFREASGANAVNSGSAALTSTIAGTTTLAQTGKLGAGEAISTDALTSRVVVTNAAALSGLAACEYVFLMNPTNSGEGTLGTIFNWGDSVSRLLINGSEFNFRVDLATSDASADTTGNKATPLLGVWSLLFASYDDTAKVASLYSGRSGAVSTLVTGAAGTGNFVAPVADLYLANRLSNDRTFNGLFDEVMVFSRQLTAAERLALTQLTGV